MLSHSLPCLEGSHTWVNVLLSYNSSYFLNKGPHIFVVHWALQVHLLDTGLDGGDTVGNGETAKERYKVKRS